MSVPFIQFGLQKTFTCMGPSLHFSLHLPLLTVLHLILDLQKAGYWLVGQLHSLDQRRTGDAPCLEALHVIRHLANKRHLPWPKNKRLQCRQPRSQQLQSMRSSGVGSSALTQKVLMQYSGCHGMMKSWISIFVSVIFSYNRLIRFCRSGVDHEGIFEALQGHFEDSNPASWTVNSALSVLGWDLHSGKFRSFDAKFRSFDAKFRSLTFPPFRQILLFRASNSALN